MDPVVFFALSLLSFAAAGTPCLTGNFSVPGDPNWRNAAVLTQSNTAYSPFYAGAPSPGGVLFVSTVAEATAAVKCLVAANASWTVRGRGHAYDGSSFSLPRDGIILDTSALSTVTLAPDNRTVTVGAGANLGLVYAALEPYGLLINGGSCPTVGIAGLVPGGGLGINQRPLGLTIDRVTSYDIINADGQLKHVTPTTDADLFWALSGGGSGNFGVLTAITLKPEPIPPSIVWYDVIWPITLLDAFLPAWMAWAKALPPAAGTPLTSIRRYGSQAFGFYYGTVEEAKRDIVDPLVTILGQPLSTTLTPQTWLQALVTGSSQEQWNAALYGNVTLPGVMWHNKHIFTDGDWNASVLTSLRDMYQNAPEVGGRFDVYMQMDAMGGAVADVPPDSTAFPARQSAFSIQFGSFVYTDGVQASDATQRLYTLANFTESVWNLLSGPTALSYVNYLDPSLGSQASGNWSYLTHYYGVHVDRLRAVKTRVDPHNSFYRPQGIPPFPTHSRP